MTTTYYEKKAQTILICILTQIALAFGFLMPFAQGVIWPNVLLSLALLGVSLVLVQVIFVRTPVLELSESSIVLRGLKPGVFKLVQLWHRETIPLSNIRKIEVGRIRKRSLFGINIPPLSVPSKSAWNMQFLWITYCRNDREDQIYYPYLTHIRNVQDALEKLRNIRDVTHSFDLTVYS